MYIASNPLERMALGGKLIFIVKAAAFLLPLLCHSQERPFSVLENINTGVAELNGIPDKIVGCYEDGKIYSSTASSTNGALFTICEYNLATNTAKYLRIKQAKTNTTLFGRSVLSIYVRGDKVFVLNMSFLNILKRKGDQLILLKAIENIPSFNAMHRLGDDYLLLSVNYNFHPSDEAYKHTWAKYNIRTDSIYPESHREEGNAKFSYFTNNWISTYKGLIGYANTTEYRIRFYNDNFLEVDSIISNDFDPNLRVADKVPKGNQYSSDEMRRISVASDTLLYRIEKLFLIDSTKLLVTIRQPNSEFYRFDVWEKKAGIWNRQQSRQMESNFIKGKRYTIDNTDVHGFYGNHAIVVTDEKGHFYNYYYPFRNNMLTESFNMDKDLIEPLNEMTRKHQIYYGIRKIKVRTD